MIDRWTAGGPLIGGEDFNATQERLTTLEGTVAELSRMLNLTAVFSEAEADALPEGMVGLLVGATSTSPTTPTPTSPTTTTVTIGDPAVTERSTAAATSTTITSALPAYKAGDRWVAFLNVRTDSKAGAAPTGWTEITGSRRDAAFTGAAGTVAYTRVPTGTEGATVGFTQTVASEASVHIYPVSGSDTSALPVANLQFADTGATLMAHPGVTVPTTGYALLQQVTSPAGGNSATFTHLSAFANARASRVEAGNNDVQSSSARYTSVPTGATGSLDVQTAPSARWTNLVIVLAPVVTTAATTPTTANGTATFTRNEQPMETSSLTVTSMTSALTVPATAGRLLIAAMAVDKTCPDPVAPTGFTIIGHWPGTAGVSLVLAYKIATGGESSLTWGLGSGRGAVGVIGEVDWKGAAPRAGTDVQGTETAVTSRSASSPAGAAGDLIVSIAGIDTASASTPNWNMTTGPVWTGGGDPAGTTNFWYADDNTKTSGVAIAWRLGVASSTAAVATSYTSAAADQQALIVARFPVS